MLDTVLEFLHQTIEFFDQLLGATLYAASFQWFPTVWEWLGQNYVFLTLVLAIFWPIIASMVVAMAAASTWLFWLLTSAIFGIIQLIYVTYQFIAIAMDIVILCVLKTYSMVRSQTLYYLGPIGFRQRKSRRRVWRSKLYAAESYASYLAIGVEPKVDNNKMNNNKKTNNHRATSDAKNGFKRRYSSSNFEDDMSSPLLARSPSSSSPPRPVLRSNSFGEGAKPQLLLRKNSGGGGGIIDSHLLSSSRSSPNLKAMMKDDDTNNTDLIQQELGLCGQLLATTTQRLKEARLHIATHKNDEEGWETLKHLLSGVVKRNHLTTDNFLLDNARTIAERGQYGLGTISRQVIAAYQEEVTNCLDCVATAPVMSPPTTPPLLSSSSFAGHHHLGKSPITTTPPSATATETHNWQRDMSAVSEISDRITLVRKMKQNMGRTALMLSGGGSQAMYHLGTIKALIDGDLYHQIKVISGTSGGSITAAMCAVRTPEELYKHVCVKTVSTDYMLDGRMKKENIRWFPPVKDMALYWLKHSLLVDPKEFKKCCDFYYGDTTFEEAFQRTGKHVCITVTASRADAGGSTAQRLLLNHISTPHVTLASAVAASCALPGVMAPVKLLTKGTSGHQEPFEVDGVEWIDGSVQADLPFQRISTLFNVSNYVVCQTNFHVVPFLNKAHHPNQKSFYWRLFQTIEWDIRNRALKLGKLGLFPIIFGTDFSKIFKQKYHGKLTLVPRFTPMQTFGLKSLVNPTVKDMEGYLKYGQIAAWPYLHVIQDMIHLETILDDCLARLESRLRLMTPEATLEWSLQGDDVESIASSSMMQPSSATRSVRFMAGTATPSSSSLLLGAETERQLRAKVSTLENENEILKKQLEEMQRQLKLSFGTTNNTTSKANTTAASAADDEETESSNDESQKENNKPTPRELNERAVWNLLHGGLRDLPST